MAGYLLSDKPLTLPKCDYSVAIRIENGWRYELAHHQKPNDWIDWASVWLKEPQGERLEYQDVTHNVQRFAWLVDGKLSALAFFGTEASLPPRSWLMSLLAQPLDALSRRVLLRVSLLIQMPMSVVLFALVLVSVKKQLCVRLIRKNCVRLQKLVNA